MNNHKPWRITLDTNPDDCNLHCIMCEEHSDFSKTQSMRRKSGKPHRRMSLRLIQKVLKEAAELGVREVIPSTMGEPLLFGHFEEILCLCRENKLLMNLTTNGTFPRIGPLSWSEKIIPITSDIKISWNGATKKTQEKIMKGSRFDKMLENLNIFVRKRDQYAELTGHYCAITLQLTFLETNIYELADIVSLAIHCGVDRVKGHHLWTHFKEINSLSMRRSAESIRRWNTEVEKARLVAETSKTQNGKRIRLENIYLLCPEKPDILLDDGICPFLGKEIWVSAEGRFNPCCAPDKQRLSLGDFGNLNEKSLDEIWNSKAYSDLIEIYSNHPLCKICNMKIKRKNSI